VLATTTALASAPSFVVVAKIALVLFMETISTSFGHVFHELSIDRAQPSGNRPFDEAATLFGTWRGVVLTFSATMCLASSFSFSAPASKDLLALGR